MVSKRDEWLRARRRARARLPRPSIESCWVEERAEGAHRLVVRGHGLSSPGGVPTMVAVGGRPVRAVDTSDPDGLVGIVAGGQLGDEVVIDLGPNGLVTGEIGPAP